MKDELERYKRKEKIISIISWCFYGFIIFVLLFYAIGSKIYENNHQPELIIEQYNEYDLNHDGEVTISDYTIARLKALEIKDIILEVGE